MSKFRKIQNRFNMGEFSPKAIARTDLEEYLAGLRLFENFISMVNGGATKRPGSRFTVDLGDMVDPGLLPFIASRELGYVIAIDPTRADANKLVRIFRADGTEMVVDQATFLAIDGSFTTLPTDIDPKGFVYSQIADGLIITHTSGRMIPFVITRTTPNNFFLSAYTLDNPYNNSSIRTVLKVPYRDPNITALTLTPSLLTGNITIAASTAFFDAGQVGSIIKISHAGNTGAARITGFTSNVLVNATVLVGNDFGNNTASTDWEEQAWSDFRGWPLAVGFYQRRLVWGGNDAEPDSVWNTGIGNIFFLMQKKFLQDQDAVNDVSGNNFFGDDTAADPFSYSIGATEVNRISFISPGSALDIGTLSTEYIAGRSGDTYTPDNPSVRVQTGYGSSPTKVVRVGTETLYISRDGRKMRNFRFSEKNGSNISVNLSLIADHMSREGGSLYGFLDMNYQKSREVVWLINANEKLIGFTYQKDGPTLSWHKHTFGGGALLKGVTSIPNTDGVADDLFICVKRVIDGGDKYYIESIPADFDADSLNNTPVLAEDISIFLDSAKSYLVIAALGESVIPGLAHLEGEEVTVVKDGIVLADFTVNGGEIDLGQVYPQDTRFVVGYKYTAKLQTLPVDNGGDIGTPQGATKRIDRLILRLYKTFNLTTGAIGGQDFDAVPFPIEAIPNEIFTGIARQSFPGSHGLDEGIEVRSELPYPCTILSLTDRGITYD